MSLRTRVRRLEKAAARAAPVDHPRRLIEEDWLELSEA